MLLLVLQLALGALFVGSGTSKLVQTTDFAAALRLSRLPESVVAVATIAVPVLEIALAAWLFLASAAWLPESFLACSTLLAIFTVWMLGVSARKLAVRCGCFGAGGGYVGTATIARNLVLIALALAGWWLGNRNVSPLGGVSLAAVISWSSLALSVALVQVARIAVPYMTLTYDRFGADGMSEVE
ncbi:MAG: MauE/DoxX family redox-associated membrane protein [Thermomicrobiales bacterium]